MAVSDAEKQADRNNKPTSKPNRVLIDRFSKDES
jgi:hypothetical protein